MSYQCYYHADPIVSRHVRCNTDHQSLKVVRWGQIRTYNLGNGPVQVPPLEAFVQRLPASGRVELPRGIRVPHADPKGGPVPVMGTHGFNDRQILGVGGKGRGMGVILIKDFGVGPIRLIFHAVPYLIKPDTVQQRESVSDTGKWLHRGLVIVAVKDAGTLHTQVPGFGVLAKQT